MSTPRYFQGNSVTGLVKASDAVTFRDVIDKFRVPPTLGITREAFLALDKPKRNEIKQVPFFVPACFKASPSKRVYTEATHCNLIFIDIDEQKDGTCPAAPFYNDPEAVHKALEGFNFAAYTTVSSTPEKPRMRIVVSANHIPIKAYPKAVATIGSLLGLVKVTTESRVAVQPMFLPTVFSDSGEDDYPLIGFKTDGRDFDPKDISDSVYPEYTEPKIHGDAGIDALDFLRPPIPEITLTVERKHSTRLTRTALILNGLNALPASSTSSLLITRKKPSPSLTNGAKGGPSIQGMNSHGRSGILCVPRRLAGCLLRSAPCWPSRLQRGGMTSG